MVQKWWKYGIIGHQNSMNCTFCVANVSSNGFQNILTWKCWAATFFRQISGRGIKICALICIILGRGRKSRGAHVPWNPLDGLPCWFWIAFSPIILLKRSYAGFKILENLFLLIPWSSAPCCHRLPEARWMNNSYFKYFLCH